MRVVEWGGRAGGRGRHKRWEIATQPLIKCNTTDQNDHGPENDAVRRWPGPPDCVGHEVVAGDTGEREECDDGDEDRELYYVPDREMPEE